MGSVNLAVLRREIAAQATKSVETRGNRVLENAFNKQKNIFLEDFNSDQVTQSIEGGPIGSDGIVNTAKGGNLYSLIGFNSGSNPITALRKILFNKIKLRNNFRSKLVGSKVVIERTVEIPSLKEIESETSGKYGVGDWTNKSWVRLIEDGIPWFRYYLFGGFGSPPSRSGTGIQAKKRGSDEPQAVRNESFSGIPYLSRLLKNFRDRIRG